MNLTECFKVKYGITLNTLNIIINLIITQLKDAYRILFKGIFHNVRFS